MYQIHHQAKARTDLKNIWQVRQGIYTCSKERWKNYQTHLQPCIAVLARAGILDDTGNWLEYNTG